MTHRRITIPLAGALLTGTVLLGATSGSVTASVYACTTPAAPADALQFGFIGRFSAGALPSGQTAAEIVAYEQNTLYVMSLGAVDVVDITDPAAPTRTSTISLPGDPTSVAVDDGLVAISVPAADKTLPGAVLFFAEGVQIGAVEVGALPDMVTITPDGKRLLVANEAEPNSYGAPGSVDPEGSISIIELKELRKSAKEVGKTRGGKPAQIPEVVTISFSDFNIGGSRAAELPAGVRLFGPGSSVAQDLEPEYITVADDSKTAWVSLQENNALAILDLKKQRVSSIVALGTNDHSRPGFGIDASDQGGTIDIRNWPVQGMYMPDGIANYEVKGQPYVLTANEGDARDWPGVSSNGEEARRARSVADLTLFPDASDNTKLGRLNVTPFAPASSGPTGKLTSLYSFGSRSFSIRSADGSLVWDSGDDFECLTASALPTRFNASNSNDTIKNRSDDKGPEPESVVVGSIGKRQYAFVGLERIGGAMVYDITDPAAPAFQQYLTTRTFGGAVVGPDSGPEGMVFIPARQSPTHQPLLVYGNEVTGTVAIWGLTG